MKNWKLLGELSAEEVKLECERANLVVKQNSSQNLVRLSKYIMTTGYDPETFYFNTLYQGNKNAPLVGMAAPGGNVQAGFSSSRTRILPLEAAPTPASSSTSAQLDESVEQILALLTTMAGDVQRLVTLTQQQLNALPPTPFIGSGGRSWSDDGQTSGSWSKDEQTSGTWSDDGQTSGTVSDDGQTHGTWSDDGQTSGTWSND